ncbi:MAG: glycosyltransferase family 2 protein [Deltaproteobacteria bacterium]|nr:glycosyltransferase family 2 protein [Deltaproteobacteria bacterium]
MFEAIFWSSILLLGYTYVGYPALIRILSGLRPKIVRKAPFYPRIVIVVISHNEEINIRGKITNLLSLEYPKGKRRIVIVSDASTDGTDDIVQSYKSEGVSLIRMDERMGKSAILNRVLPELDEEFVVLSDSRQTWNTESLRTLLENFSDPSVGAVSGELVLAKGDGSFGEGLGFYWNYEKSIRKCEAAYDSTCGVTGCIYALRRSFFETIPGDTLLDDLVIPMNITKKGHRVVFEDRALAYDRVDEEPRTEWNRKIRTLSGNYQAFFAMPWLFHPFRNRLFLQLVSHKVMRIVAPFFLIACLLSNVFILQYPVYKAAFAAQVIFYGLALISFWADARVLKPIKTFVFLNAVALMSLPVYLSGKQKVAWK